MSPYLRFESSFWSPQSPSATIPDFSVGLNVLHQKIAQSRVENEEIIAFLKDRVAVEELYGAKLSELSRTKGNPHGFLRDEGAGLRRSYESLKEESEELGAGHKQLAVNITELVLKPLTRFTDDYKRKVTLGKATVDQKLRQFEVLAKEMDKARVHYTKKCRDADAAEENALRTASSETTPVVSVTPTGSDPPDTPPSEEDYRTLPILQLGDQQYTAAELDAFLRRVRQAVPATDYKTQLMGTYHNVSSGLDIAKWLQENVSAAENTLHGAETLGQQLVGAGIIKLVSARGAKFQASATAWYQWKLRDDDATSMASTVKMGGIFERLGSIGTNGANGLEHEPTYKRVRKEAERADEAYRNSVKRVDGMRLSLEQTLFAHFQEMEHAEFDRINFIKQVFIDLAATMSNTIPAAKAICDRMVVYQEALRPEHDVQFIVEQYRTGGFSPKPILYENYYHGSAIDQTFGVSIEDITRASRTSVPKIVTEALTAIEQGSEKFTIDEKKLIWTTPIPLDKVHAVRTDLNSGSESITADRLRPFDSLLLAGVLRLYFRELPECLLTVELYDAAKILYSSNDQDEDLRLASISNLIATLPSPNFNTLDALIAHLHRIVKETADPENPDDDTLVTSLSQSLGPILLRPRVEAPVNIHDKHPHRLLKDLIRRHDFVFSDATRKSHQENLRRRSFVPLKATDSTISIPGLPSPQRTSADDRASLEAAAYAAGNLAVHPASGAQPSDKSVKRRSLLTFMSRGGGAGLDDGAKRGVNSVLGIITNRSSTSSDSPLPTPVRPSADSYTTPSSSILSPIMSPSPPPPATPTSPIIPIPPRPKSSVVPEDDEEPYEKTFGAQALKARGEEAMRAKAEVKVEEKKEEMVVKEKVEVNEEKKEVEMKVEADEGEPELDPFFADE
ncbi:hypothetical protein BC937DRAFT_93443 [Endogone sp. FLAS-F59071]|nr:hypothetical protein BC937DRAFT_93443 [Endogone sp. FLAS-F59071]|eukprot:RUS14707.1 hypothetical protein BC937DRAFT_93443 [Endogone sp. FLAS-F59071]